MISLIGVSIDHRFGKGDDLTGIILRAIETCVELPGGLQSGDIVVITSKIVAKVEGRVIAAPDREDAITAEAVRVVASKMRKDDGTPGSTRIVQNKHGLILAAAGVDASNTEDGTVVLLPQDPDASARTLRESIQQVLGISIGVIITDTLGRAWRRGLTDHAIGASGIRVLDDLAGTHDSFGRLLKVTMVAVADQLAAASELVRAKSSLTPVAVIRGAHTWVTNDDQPSARDLVRPTEEDLFSLGTNEARTEGAQNAVFARRTVRSFTETPVPAAVVDRALRAAASAPAPHHTKPWRFLVLVRGEDDQLRHELLDAMQATWKSDLAAEGRTNEDIAQRVSKGSILRTAHTIIFPFVDLAAGAHTYPLIDGIDVGHRNASEQNMFHIAGGAAIENMLISIAADNFGSAWISSSIFCPATMRHVVKLPDTYWPLGGVAIGEPTAPARERPNIDIQSLLIRRETNT